MSEENAAVVQRAYELLNSRDAEALVELCADDFLMDMRERVFNPDTYEGADGIRRFLHDVDAAWESYRWTVDETRVADDVVVAMVHCEGQSREGGPEVNWDVAWLWRFRRETPMSLCFHRDPTRALEAAGLRE
jgi:ketosteroid isomerase-like protein